MLSRALLAVLPSFLVISCASGPNDFREVPASQPHAMLKPGRVVKNPLPFIVSDTSILEIDGKQPVFMRWDSRFRIKPGDHVLGLQNYSRTHTGLAEVKFNARVGKTYVVKSDAVGTKIKFWIEEEDTGKSVGGGESPRGAVYSVPGPPIFIPVG